MNGIFGLGVAMAVAALACEGCATTGGIGPANVGAGSVAPPGGPPSECVVTAGPSVVGSGAYVPAGVAARLEGGTFTIRFARPNASCAEASAVADPAANAWVESRTACPGEQGPAVSLDRSTSSSEGATDALPPRLRLGVLWAGERTHTQLGFAATSYGSASPASGTEIESPAALPGGRFLETWVDGDAEALRARARVLTPAGTPEGAPFDVSPADLSVIGPVSAAFGPDGRGIVAFLASNERGFDVLATPVTCAFAPASGAR